MENYFASFRQKTIGLDQSFVSPDGRKDITYADWTASGRNYADIEKTFLDEIFPRVANTHTETTFTGHCMTKAYAKAKQVIKTHVNADAENDALIFVGSGMTGAIAKMQRILGLQIPERLSEYVSGEFAGKKRLERLLPIADENRPVVFITHMEHHSNHTSWVETICDLEIIRPTTNGDVDLGHLAELFLKYRNRKLKIASVTACSNVTGIQTKYHEIAKIAHRNGGLCFVDFACSGPYVDIDMHPTDPMEKLDAVMLSPHKFLGGPGASGVLIFCKELYQNTRPDIPGGGTVNYTNPWNLHKYFSDVETREDGGTPPFLQGIKAALAVKLKEEMGVANMLQREHELLEIIFDELDQMEGIQVFEKHRRDRLGVISFHIPGLNYTLAAKLINDKFGIQMRAGCACAGTYGHYLFDIDEQVSLKIHDQVMEGNLAARPGFVRMSIHPITTDEEARFLCNSLKTLIANKDAWSKDYHYDQKSNEFVHNDAPEISHEDQLVAEWFGDTDKASKPSASDVELKPNLNPIKEKIADILKRSESRNSESVQN